MDLCYGSLASASSAALAARCVGKHIVGVCNPPGCNYATIISCSSGLSVLYSLILTQDTILQPISCAFVLEIGSICILKHHRKRRCIADMDTQADSAALAPTEEASIMHSICTTRFPTSTLSHVTLFLQMRKRELVSKLSKYVEVHWDAFSTIWCSSRHILVVIISHNVEESFKG